MSKSKQLGTLKQVMEAVAALHGPINRLTDECKEAGAVLDDYMDLVNQTYNLARKMGMPAQDMPILLGKGEEEVRAFFADAEEFYQKAARVLGRLIPGNSVAVYAVPDWLLDMFDDMHYGKAGTEATKAPAKGKKAAPRSRKAAAAG